MKTVKILTTIVAVAFLAGSAVMLAGSGDDTRGDGLFAGPPHGRPGMGGPGGPMPGLHMIADRLDLTEAQRTELHQIIQEELTAAHDRIKARMEANLTPEQQAELATIQEEMEGKDGFGMGMPRGRGFGHGPMGGPDMHRMDRMARELELTEAQQEQIRDILAKAVPAARDDIRAKVAEALTPEQQEKLEKMHEERMERMERMHDWLGQCLGE